MPTRTSTARLRSIPSTRIRLPSKELPTDWTPAQIRAAGGGAGQFTITYGTPAVVVTYYDLGLYFSDDWRWKPNFTVSYGLRFETQTDIHDNGDLAPRVSFAWGLGKGNTIAEDGVARGLGHVLRPLRRAVRAASRPAEWHDAAAVHREPAELLPDRASAGQPAAGYGQDVSDDVPDLRRICARRTSMQTAVSVERQITKNANIAISYLNSRGVHQYLTRNINAPLPGTYDPNDPTSGVRPYRRRRGNIYQYESGGTFEQNQLIVNANVRVGSKVSLFGWYTLNNVNANTSGPSSFPNNQYNLAENYGPTAYDVRNRAFIGGTVALPRGFRLNPFLVVTSGIPFNITLGQDYNGDSIFNDRPTFADWTDRTEHRSDAMGHV